MRCRCTLIRTSLFSAFRACCPHNTVEILRFARSLVHIDTETSVVSLWKETRVRGSKVVTIYSYARPFGWLVFFGIILWAWWYLFAMSGDMGMTLTGGMRMGGDAMSGDAMGSMSPMQMQMTNPMVLYPMWIIMMAAMMGPSFVPTAMTYDDLITTGAGSRGGFWGLVGGYLGTWFVAGAGIATLHVLFLQLGLLSSMGKSTSAVFTATLLGAAGIYQFTSVKTHCLDHCRSPLAQFLAHWHPGVLGGARMGMHHGLYCIGCCWGIMMLGFVGGAMNIVWMGIATLIMTLEKLPDIGRWLTLPLGIAFLALAGWNLLSLF